MNFGKPSSAVILKNERLTSQIMYNKQLYLQQILVKLYAMQKIFQKNNSLLHVAQQGRVITYVITLPCWAWGLIQSGWAAKNSVKKV